MPRKPKPFLHQGAYYTSTGGVWRKLATEAEGLAAAETALAVLTGTPRTGLTVRELVARLNAHAATYYVKPDGSPTGEAKNVAYALGFLETAAGDLPIAQLTKDHLKAVVELMRPHCSRKTCNANLQRIRRMFTWASGEGLIPDSVTIAAKMLPNLPAFRSGAAEYDPIAAVPLSDVRRTVERMPQPYADMVRLQWWSGLRPGEVRGLRLSQVQPGENDCFTLEFGINHKTGWRGKTKTVHLGPQASAILRPWVLVAIHRQTQHVFTIARSRKRTPYPAGPTAINNAVARAARAAGVPHWHPNQLRPALATRVRAEMGLEAAQIALGHTRADVSQIYAARNDALATKIADRLV